ncbi:hypothetical protein HWV62_26809 [Athelia sp. TMB]|nr:hypothetical protein HWV62_26809 [Athelia sp. TMB]
MSVFGDRCTPSLESISTAASVLSYNEEDSSVATIQNDPVLGSAHDEQRSWLYRQMQSASSIKEHEQPKSTLRTPATADVHPIHEYFYFPAENIYFLVSGVLYSVHRYFFERDSSAFIGLGLSKQNPMILADIGTRDFDLFLSIFYPRRFGLYTASTVEDWSSILQLAHQWGFESIKVLAAQNLAPIASPIDKIVFGRRYGVDHWLKSAYKAVCLQEAPLNLQEGRRLGVDDVIRINAVRYHHVPDRRPLIIPLSDKHIEDTFSLPAESGYQAKESDVATKENAPIVQDEIKQHFLTLEGDDRIGKQEKEESGEEAADKWEQTEKKRSDQDLLVPTESQPPEEVEAVEAAYLQRQPLMREDEEEESSTPEPSNTPQKKNTDDSQYVKEFFAVRNLENAEDFIQKLSPANYSHIVDRLLNTAMWSEDADVQLVADFFARAAGKKLCSQATFEEGFAPTAKALHHIANGAPKAFDRMAAMMKGAGLDEHACKRIAAQCPDGGKLLALFVTPHIEQREQGRGEKIEQSEKEQAIKEFTGLGESQLAEELKAPEAVAPWEETLGARDTAGQSDALKLLKAGKKTNMSKKVEELFAVRNLDNTEDYFQKITTANDRVRLIVKLVYTAIESTAADARLVAAFFERVGKKELCSQISFEEGFMPIAEVLDSIVSYAPKALGLMAIMMKGAGFNAERRNVNLTLRSSTSICAGTSRQNHDVNASALKLQFVRSISVLILQILSLITRVQFETPSWAYPLRFIWRAIPSLSQYQSMADHVFMSPATDRFSASSSVTGDVLSFGRDDDLMSVDDAQAETGGYSHLSSPRFSSPNNALLVGCTELNTHKRYHFDDGTVQLIVEGVLYSIHRHFLEKDSSFFKLNDKRSQPIALPGIKCLDFDRFLSIFYPREYGSFDASTIEDWKSILSLADRWEFKRIKPLAIKQIAPIASPLDIIVLGRRYSIHEPEWPLSKAYNAVCVQAHPLTLEEGNLLGMEDVIKIMSIRQSYKLGLYPEGQPAPPTLEETRQHFGILDCVNLSSQLSSPTSITVTNDALASISALMPGPTTSEGIRTNRLTQTTCDNTRPSTVSLVLTTTSAIKDTEIKSSETGYRDIGDLDTIKPLGSLKPSVNRWAPNLPGKQAPIHDPNSPEMVERKVRSLLNKLTMQKFDSISDQIIAWVNRSEREKGGHTLIDVIRLMFEQATDEAAWSEMYARLCRKMMEKISASVQDTEILNNEGKPIAGGQLFRKYLLNRCQEDFERGWAAKDAAAAATAAKASDDEAIKTANAKNKDGGGDDEPVLYSEEYYAAQKAKRQGLGLIKFIGELFKLQMLTERIMFECVKKLLGNVETPEEEEIESLCKLLSTVGALLDTPKARAHMVVYFSRMKELTRSGNVSSRMQFMLQDIIELRERKWRTSRA